MSDILSLIGKRTLLLDGGLGSELLRRGFPQGACLESWNLDRPDVIKEVHASYFDAGSDAVTTNSLGASSIKLSSFGLSSRAYDLNRKSAELAASVRPEGRFIGGCMGPVGKFLKPQGELDEAELYASFAEQARGLYDGGVDFLFLETQYDLQEALVALKSARQATPLPVFATMTFERRPRGFFTIMGNTPEACFRDLEAAGAAALGANCSLDSQDMAVLSGILRPLTTLPLIVQANAGRPSLSEEGQIVYSQGVSEYVRFVPEMIKNGVDIIGGCCGTNPDYIRAMAKLVKS